MEDVLRVEFGTQPRSTSSTTHIKNVRNQYERQKKIGRYGWASIASVTLIGSAAMGDQMFATTVIPVIGPFLTISRVESDPTRQYLPGAKDMLIFSGVAQVGFFSYWMLYAILDMSEPSNESFQIAPNREYPGLIVTYTFGYD